MRWRRRGARPSERARYPRTRFPMERSPPRLWPRRPRSVSGYPRIQPRITRDAARLSRSMALVLRRTEQDLARLRIVLTWGRSLRVGQHFQGPLNGRARPDSVEPFLDLGELGPVDAVAFARAQPRKDRDVGDRVFGAGKVRRLR